MKIARRAFFFTLFLAGFAINSWSGALDSSLTPVSEVQAQALFSEIAANKKIPFDYPDGCYAKAQQIALLLDAKGIVSEKAFVEGNIFSHSLRWGESFWTFHVAPVILVNTGTALVKEVIDPFLSSRLLPYEEWLEIVSKDPRTKINSTYFTNRFVYSPEEKNSELSAYDPELLKDMNIVFGQLWKNMEHE
jgi:hypothetical protein